MTSFWTGPPPSPIPKRLRADGTASAIHSLQGLVIGCLTSTVSIEATNQAGSSTFFKNTWTVGCSSYSFISCHVFIFFSVKHQVHFQDPQVLKGAELSQAAGFKKTPLFIVEVVQATAVPKKYMEDVGNVWICHLSSCHQKWFQQLLKTLMPFDKRHRGLQTDFWMHMSHSAGLCCQIWAYSTSSHSNPA